MSWQGKPAESTSGVSTLDQSTCSASPRFGTAGQ
jgi:hypothetical protein